LIVYIDDLIEKYAMGDPHEVATRLKE